MLIEPAGILVVAPEPATGRLSACNGRLRRNGRMILACTPGAPGPIVATDGLVGLIKKG
jgi:hypothetical protein